MEKYGILVEGKKNTKEKTAATACTHPAESRKVDGDVVFCEACEKYLPQKKGKPC